MSDYAEVEIQLGSPLGSKVLIDGREVRGIRALHAYQTVNHMPSVVLEVIPQRTRIVGSSEVEVRISPQLPEFMRRDIYFELAREAHQKGWDRGIKVENIDAAKHDFSVHAKQMKLKFCEGS